MPAWFEGIPTILALLAIAAGSAFLALGIAHLLGFHRKGQRPAASEDALAVVERLASYADIAKREGLLSLEGRLESDRVPLLACAVALALEGAPLTKIQETLDAEVDAAATRPGSRVLSLALHLPRLLVIAGSGLLLLTMIRHAQDPASVGVVAVSASLTLLFAGLVLPSFAVAAVSHQHRDTVAHTYTSLLQSVGAVLICSGADAQQVRASLRGLIAGNQPASPIARAA